MRALCCWLMIAGLAGAQQVTDDRLRNALQEQQNWLTYFGDYSGQRHRDLKQINTANVADLRLEWVFQTGQPGAFETVPLVVDGVMYLTASNGNVFAVDAASGRQLWQYQYPLPKGIKLCCGTINRGAAILGNHLFITTPDAHLVALDVRTGKLVWDTEMAPAAQGYGATIAPIVAKGKVIVGVSGGEFGIRGFVDAYDAKTGQRAWRFWTIPQPHEPGGDTWKSETAWKTGGGATWMTGTYDPALETLYWGVGNPGPDLYGEDRLGDNLYSNSLVALDINTGQRKWHFQFTPHDTHDWDACETPMLLDLPWQGKMRKLVVQANRNAFYYVLDRETGEFLLGKPFGRQTWAKGLDEKGRPIKLPNIDATAAGNRICPGLAGGANWMATSYSPQTKLLYVPVREACDVYYAEPPQYVAGKPYWGGLSRAVPDEPEYGLVKAMDPLTGETKWDFRMHRAPWAGTLSTAGGLVFAGDEDGYLMALAADSGKLLWRVYTGNRLVTSPMTYTVQGKQYVTMPSGAALLTFGLKQ